MPEVVALSPDQEPDFSIFENKTGLADDLKFLASMPELCDVTFLVGETRGKLFFNSITCHHPISLIQVIK